jgi:hypothetical protein
LKEFFMFLDRQTRLATAQTLAASGATTDYLDTTQARNLGDGEPMCMVFTMTTAADYVTTDEAYTFAIQCDDNAGFASPTTLESRLYSLANGNGAGTNLLAGAQVILPFPQGLVEQYVRGYVTEGGTTPTCTFNCDIVPLSFVRKPKDYPSAFSVL